MIPLEEALRRVLSSLPPTGVESVEFREAQGRILAECYRATCDIPPFSKSAVDGYALRSADVIRVPVELACVGEIRAGAEPSASLFPGEVCAIMTGAPVPQGADAVEMVEHAVRSEDGRRVAFARGVSPGENIIPAASEASAGDVVLHAGRSVGPAEMAVLATFGHTRVRVHRRPSIALLATGDELREVEHQPGPGQIRNSNSYLLMAQLRCMGLRAEYLGIARDNPAELADRIGRGLERDVLILTGGVSVGTYDLVRGVLEGLGLQVILSRIAMRPGKPTVFARRGPKLVFALPGNPLSTFVAFETLVRPALGRLCGLARPELPRVVAELLTDLGQKRGRISFLPAAVRWQADGWKAQPLRFKGSSDIVGFCRANALIVFPGDQDRMAKGDNIEVLLLPDYWERQMANGG